MMTDYFLNGTPIIINDTHISIIDRPGVKWTIFSFYVLVFCSCCFGNLLILSVIAFHRTMRSVTNFFLANLAVADLLVGIFCVIQNMLQMSVFGHGQWEMGETLCHFYVFTLHLVPCASAGILVLLSVERYIAVLRPLLAGVLLTKPVLAFSTAFIWFLSIVVNFSYLFSSSYHIIHFPKNNITITTCVKDYDSHKTLRLIHTLSVVLWYLVPLLILLFIYSQIGRVLWQSTGKKSIARSSARSDSRTNARKPVKAVEIAGDEMTSLTGSHMSKRNSEGGGARPSRALRKQKSGDSSISEALEHRKKVIRLVVAVVLAFAVLCLPRNVYLLWNAWRPQTERRCIDCLSAVMQPISFLLLFANSGINPFLYAFFSERFRSAIVDICLCRNEREVRRQKVVSRSTFHRQTTLTSDVDGESATPMATAV